ncbi:MAG: hypothetical protein U5L11_15990 [Arhodomonas sp.]|nr:hypothetical protein [Arhodomonas sp.]
MATIGSDPRSNRLPSASYRTWTRSSPLHQQGKKDIAMSEIERIDTGTRMSKIVKHGGVA